jgi:hypothetical protein
MDKDTAHLIKAIIGGLVRYALSGVVGWLIARRILTPAQAPALLNAITLAVITVAWGTWRKYKIRKRIKAALALPAGSTPRQLDREMKSR